MTYCTRAVAGIAQRSWLVPRTLEDFRKSADAKRGIQKDQQFGPTDMRNRREVRERVIG